MTIADLWRQHESKPRNRLLAQAFFLIKYVEQFGTGIQRILDDCHAQKVPEPAFEVHGQTFRAIFKPGKVTGKPKMDVELNERQKTVLEYVRQHGRIIRAEYEKLTGVSYRTAVREINELVSNGHLQRCGGGRDQGRWHPVMILRATVFGTQMARKRRETV